MMQKNSTLVRSSRYVAGGTAEVNSRAIEWWERLQFRTAADDTIYVVEKSMAGRLDMIAAMFLGEPRHWWIIAMLNNILDPSSEVKEGITLRIPSQDRMKTLLTGTTGGVPSTRQAGKSVFPIV